jgi:mono/diheme cytochrome c family protein
MLREIHYRPAFIFALGCVATLLVALPLAAQSANPEESEAEVPAVSAAPPSSQDIAAVYVNKCASCHGEDGQGVADGDAKPIRTDRAVDELAKLIVKTMPEDDPDACVGEEARRLAEYIRAHFAPERPAVVPRISRLTVEQYRNAITDVMGRFPSVATSESETQLSDPEVPGLRGEYFQSQGMSKADRLGHYRSDTRLEFDFGSDSPVPSVSADQFAIIWKGGLIAEHTGYYEFRIRTENGARLYLNLDPTPSRRKLRDDSSMAGQQALIDAWVGSGSLREKSARVYLLGGRSYPIRLEFFKYLEEGASVSLEWKPPHGSWSILDYNHTRTTRPGRVFVCETRFPADDRSLGYARGSSVSRQWHDAVMDGAIEAAAEVVARLPLLAGLQEDEPDEARNESETESERVERAERVNTFVLEFARVAYRRPLTGEEREVTLDLVEMEQANLEAGVRRAVIMILMSPHFLYPDLTPMDEKPSPYAIASRLSFGLWDSIPDRELIEAAASGRLDSFEEIESQARRMLGDQRVKAKMRSFFRSWLELEYRDLSKDKELFPEFDDAVVADLRRSLELFIDRVVWSRDSDYRQLLQADYLMLNDRLAALYRSPQTESDKELDGEEIKRRARQRQFASEFQPVEFAADRRSGVLTHPYLLSAYAYHNNTSPIHRGVFLTRNIVGRALSPPPMAVAFKDDEFSKDLTMREKITQLTRDSACMSCHSVINPLGFTLENFDAVGRWRVTENLKPVNTTSEYTTASGEKLQLASARDVANIAVKSESAHQSFITHVFQHIVKRSPRDVGPELLEQLRVRFEKDNFNVQKLWARIAAVAAVENLVDTSTLLVESSP